MNTMRNAGGEIWDAANGVNQFPLQAPTNGMEMFVYQTRLIDEEVRNTVVQMAQAISLQAQAITT